MIERQIDNPMPVPSGLVVKNGLKSFSSIVGIDPYAGFSHRNNYMVFFTLA